MARRSKSAMIQSADILLRENDYEVIPNDKCHCTYHKKGSPILAIANFYDTSDVSIFRNSRYGKIPICKACINEIYTNYYTSSQDAKWSLFKVCEKLDIPFFNSIYEGALKEGKNDWQKTFGLYMKTYNSFKSKNNWQYNFDNSESIDDTAEELEDKKQVEADKLKLTNEEKRIKKEVINLLEIDPFDGHSIVDQKFLYGNILGYLNEDSGDDKYKISAIMQLCNNNNQISKCQKLISQNSNTPENLIKNMNELKSLDSRVNALVANNKKIAEDNGISEKFKKDSGAGKNTLAEQMKNLREYGFEDVLVNYHNQLMSKSFKRVADISNRSILDQLMLDENDFTEIVSTQRELIKGLEDRALKAEESLRQYHESKQVSNNE